jgi:hypothetical protein
MKTLDFYRISEFNTVGGTPRSIGNFTNLDIAKNIADGIAQSRKLLLVHKGKMAGEGYLSRWTDARHNIALTITTETLTIQ